MADTDTLTGSTAADTASGTRPELHREFRAMASRVTVRVIDPAPGADAAVDRVAAWFADVESACTRFDPTSPLMTANAAAGRRTDVGQICARALREAYEAYRLTEGRYDPRTLDALVALGYDRSLDFGSGTVRTSGSPGRDTTPRARRWRPRFSADGRHVRLGRRPIDLGGIGKGFAVRGALALLRGDGAGVGAGVGTSQGSRTTPIGAGALVEAGGDLATFGAGPEGPQWRASVEDPFGGTDPVAVLDVTDAAAATSSIRLRSWHADGRPVHHLIDPRTGEPADSGLVAVTVVGTDPAVAEVWSKALFVAGRTGIRSTAATQQIAALWVDSARRIGFSPAMRERLLWSVDRVG